MEYRLIAAVAFGGRNFCFTQCLSLRKQAHLPGITRPRSTLLKSGEANMGFLAGVIGLAVGLTGFWLNFELNPMPVSAGPLDSGYFDLGTAGILVATLGFMTQIVMYAVRRTPKTRYIRAKG
jgi:hypothetical protein